VIQLGRRQAAQSGGFKAICQIWQAKGSLGNERRLGGMGSALVRFVVWRCLSGHLFLSMGSERMAARILDKQKPAIVRRGH